jgi:HAMP domain-containing protein/tRNA A-37 threonylcarbamoyl transferase component Bud32
VPGVTATTNPERRGLSLGTRISLATLLLIALSVGTAVAVTFFLIRKVAHDSARDSLKSSAAVQETLQARRYERLQLLSRVFLSNPSLTAYLSQAAESMDTKSLLDQLSQGREDLGFDFAILLDPNGVVMARTDKNATGQSLARRPLVAKALEEFQATGVWREDDRLYYAVASPVEAQFTVYGYLITGFAITEVQAREVNEISGADVAFLADVEGKPNVVATTLPAPLARSLAAAAAGSRPLVDQMKKASGAAHEVELELGGEPWLALATPLLDAAGQPVGATVALASVTREMAAYREIEAALLAAGLFSALLGGIASFVIARRTLAPVRRLVAATAAARQGDYDQKIAADRNDEVGQLARSFGDLLADLREKRDMEAYVTELSRNLPEPQQGRAVVGSPQSREVLLMGIELRRYARATESGPQEILERLALDLKQATAAVQAQRGQVDGIAGHRVLARFEGEGRGRRALTAASRILGTGPEEDPAAADEAPALAFAAGRAVTGPVSFGDQMERALVGFPVQQIDSLLREASPGEVLLSREVHDELRDAFAQVGYRLAERRGLLSPQPLYVVSARIAAHVTGVRGVGSGDTPRESVATGGVPTLSGIAPGALMGLRFEILSVLGAGGMGVVYKARDRELDDLVALKMLKRELWGDRNQLERLKSELKLARKITHPNVLRTHDFGDIDGIPYISMEYVRGVTLRYLLDQSGRLPYSAGLRLAKQLCAGLGAAHAVGVMHRDIKPENLILEPTGNAKLMDFGIARPIHRLEAGQTEAGWIVGTPLYLSPEQLQGHEIDTRADIYSTGVVLYEMFTGALPFNAPNAVEIMLKHLREPPPPLASHWPEIPPRLEAIVLRCLAKEPDARFRSVDELLHDLEGLSA